VGVAVVETILNVAAFEGDVPGLVTVTEAVPTLAIIDDITVAVSKAELENVVASGVPFQLTTAPDTKFDPYTVSVKLGPPARAVSGKIDETVAEVTIVVTSLA
jgi:hypothetical protein